MKFKPVEELKLGEELYLGGEIIGLGQAYAGDNIYEYKGSFMTGSHAIFENGSWIRARDSKYSNVTELPEDTVVYPVSCENHLMVTKDFISADYSEVDFGEMSTEQEKLKELNENTFRNNMLLKEETKLEGSKCLKKSC